MVFPHEARQDASKAHGGHELDSRGTLALLSARDLRTFCTGEKYEKPMVCRIRADLKNPLLKEDKSRAGHRPELECERCAPNSLLNPVMGENLQDLHQSHDEELECQRDLLYQTLLNPVQGVNLEDLSSIQEPDAQAQPPPRPSVPRDRQPKTFNDTIKISGLSTSSSTI